MVPFAAIGLRVRRGVAGEWIFRGRSGILADIALPTIHLPK